MNRRLKVASLFLAAAFAIGATLASSASAQFESEAENTTVFMTLNEMQEFEVRPGGLIFECGVMKVFKSTVIPKAVTTVSVEPEYNACQIVFGQTVTVFPNECREVFTLVEGSTIGSASIECEPGEAIEIRVGSLCTYRISTQTGLTGSITYRNVNKTGEPQHREIEAEPEVGSIVSTRVTNHFPFLCPAGSNEGFYRGNAIVRGVSGTQVGIFVD